MFASSHITNLNTSPLVRTCLADFPTRRRHSANMARRGIPKQPVNWFLREWMVVQGVKTQTAMMEKTGWSKATMSQLYNGNQGYSPKIIAEAAAALQIQEYELLMPPEQAMAYRRLKKDALRIVEDAELLQDRTGTLG